MLAIRPVYSGNNLAFFKANQKPVICIANYLGNKQSLFETFATCERVPRNRNESQWEMQTRTEKINEKIVANSDLLSNMSKCN